MDRIEDRLEAGLVARDLPALEAFYVGALGFAVVDRMTVPEFGTIVRLRRGAARCKLYAPAGRLDPPAPGPVDEYWYRPGGWRYVALRLDGPETVEALCRTVAAAGGTVVLAPRSHRPGASVAVVTDPEGNVWELLADAADRAEAAEAADPPDPPAPSV